MAGAMSRNKGSAAEREIFKLLSKELGITIERNLSQARSGGADSNECIGPFAIEVKRGEVERLQAWWQQAVKQAQVLGKYPLLLYRRSRQPWRGLVEGRHLINICAAESGITLNTSTVLNGPVTLDIHQIIELLQMVR